MNRKMYISRDIGEEKKKKFFSEFVKGDGVKKNILFRAMNKKEMERIKEINELPDYVIFQFEKIEEVKFYGRDYSLITFTIEIIFKETNEIFSSSSVSFILNLESEKNFVMEFAMGKEISICNYIEVYEDSYFNLNIEFPRDESLIGKIKDIKTRDITLEEEIDVLEIFNKKENIEEEVIEKDLSEDNLKKMMGL